MDKETWYSYSYLFLFLFVIGRSGNLYRKCTDIRGLSERSHCLHTPRASMPTFEDSLVSHEVASSPQKSFPTRDARWLSVIIEMLYFMISVESHLWDLCLHMLNSMFYPLGKERGL